MNYAKATKRTIPHSAVLWEINSQAELELGHRLTQDEQETLFTLFPPKIISERIHKVTFHIFFQQG